MEYPILDQIRSPSDLKRIPERELPGLCGEIRSFLIDTISRTGGHLASNLGTVELTVAMHRVFDSPQDKLVFDVGHQCYTHKLLTGRRAEFETLRRREGISGFPKPKENPHDAFIAGHASTSISAAYGIAKAFQLRGDPHTAVALIGDGALTGGLAYEGLNNAGRSGARLVVILNHNDQSISKNVGAFARYLSTMRSRPGYLKLKRRVDRVLLHTPLVGKPLKSWLERSKSLLKTILYRSTFFEEMGFAYLGPVDGHDVFGLIRVLERAREIAAPVIVQVETVKGKGYAFAEENPGAYHATSGFDILNGGDNVVFSDCYSNQAGEELTRLAKENDRICAITAAMKYGTGLHTFYAAHRERFFDVGIAEEHAVTFAGGLASRGMLPVLCIYSTFLQRSYDQIIHDLAIDNNKHVVLCVDRAGIVGEDGETHQGVFDAAFLSGIPGVTIYAPEGYDELRLCIRRAVMEDTGISAVRYPRGKDTRQHDLPASEDLVFVDEGSRTLLVSYGRVFSNCYLGAARCAQAGHPISLLKLTRIQPLPPKAIAVARQFDRILFVEEGIRRGGIAEHLGLELLTGGWSGTYRIIAIGEEFVAQGKPEECLAALGMDPASVARAALELETGCPEEMPPMGIDPLPGQEEKDGTIVGKDAS